MGRKVAEINEKKAINSGYDYRVYVSCTIRDSEGVIILIRELQLDGIKERG